MATHIATAFAGFIGVALVATLLLSDVKRWNYSLIRRTILDKRIANSTKEV